MPMNNPFENPAFSMSALSAAINIRPISTASWSR